MELTLQNSIKAFPLEKDCQYFLWVDREKKAILFSCHPLLKTRGGVELVFWGPGGTNVHCWVCLVLQGCATANRETMRSLPPLQSVTMATAPW